MGKKNDNNHCFGNLHTYIFALLNSELNVFRFSTESTKCTPQCTGIPFPGQLYSKNVFKAYNIRRKSPKIMSKCLVAACTRNRASTHSVHSLNSVGILGTLGTDTHTPIRRRLIGSCSYIWHLFLRNVLLLSVTSQSGSRFKTVQVNKQADDRCV